MVLSLCKIIRHDTCALVLSYDLTIYLKCLFIAVDAFLCKYIAPDNKYSDETFQLGICWSKTFRIEKKLWIFQVLSVELPSTVILWKLEFRVLDCCLLKMPTFFYMKTRKQYTIFVLIIAPISKGYPSQLCLNFINLVKKGYNPTEIIWLITKIKLDLFTVTIHYSTNFECNYCIPSKAIEGKQYIYLVFYPKNKN